ncbi:hypothetical protein LCM02_02865 [Lutimonas saemankumensis]|uniref:hypothetical protein n=1 Tax=Lutimonas saemankumensis TaxID=483016 RepID=UPI001CD3BDEC|nr:hypothetical protein [Lutimonas saemankumensis]MCA0931378.1 hypothetical protein [Lutimonas saemankumensis]
MPFIKSIGDQDKVIHAFAKFNTGIERPLIDLHLEFYESLCRRNWLNCGTGAIC